MNIPTTSKSIPSQRQTTYGQNDIIYFNINANEVPLLNPYATFLRFYVLLTAGNTNPALDWAVGGLSVVRQIDILTKSGVLLESLQDVNGWTAVTKYFERNQAKYGLWNLEEGLSDPNNNAQPTPASVPAFNSQVGGLPSTAYWTCTETVAGACGTGTARKVECCLPLNMSGILGSDKVWPVAAMEGGGLEIRVYLDSDAAAIRSFDTYVTSQSEIPYTLPAGDTAPVPPADPNCWGLQADLVAGVAATTVVCSAGLAVAAVAARMVPMNGNQVPSCIGRHLCYQDTANKHMKLVSTATGLPVTITGVAIDVAAATLTFTMSAAYTILAADVAAVGDRVYLDNGDCTGASFQISEAEMVCGLVQPQVGYFQSLMKKVGSEGGLDLSIKSYNLYRNNLNKGITKSQLLIPTVEKRAKGIITTPRDAVPANFGKSEFLPESDNITSYQWVLKNRLVPDRRVATDRFTLGGNNWNAIGQAELSKALSSSGVNTRSLVNIGGMFSIGRKLAEMNHSYNAKDNETRLDLEYNGAAPPIKNKQFQTQVYHIRNVNVKSTGCVVSY